MTIPAPSVEYSLLLPMLIVFGVAVIGVVLEAFLPRQLRYLAQVTLALSGLIAAFISVVQLGRTIPVGGRTAVLGAIAVDRPALVLQGVVAGSTAVLSTSGCTPGAFVVFGLSIAGGGPLPSPFGPIGLTPPIELLPVQFAAGNGTASTSLTIPSVATGVSLFAQAIDFPLVGPIRLSNAAAATVQ